MHALQRRATNSGQPRPCSFKAPGGPGPDPALEGAIFGPQLLAGRHSRNCAGAHRGRSLCPWASPRYGYPRAGGKIGRLGHANADWLVAAAQCASSFAWGAQKRLGLQLHARNPFDPTADAWGQRRL